MQPVSSRGARALPRVRGLSETGWTEEQSYSGNRRDDTIPGQRLETTEHSIVVQLSQPSRNKKFRLVDLQKDGDRQWRSSEI
jgi:hypothetical protein